jgi:hypothetical protein
VAALYSLALFVSAALLFVLEPMVGKSLLPLLGSTPEVWNTTVLFFQAALLAGYAFSHATSARLAPRAQALLQVALLAVAAIALPVTVAADARPPASSNPTPWLVGTLLVTAGLPFFALAANGPMLQRWLAATRHTAGRDPYFLFAASNGGSLIGLLAYPLALEPLLTLRGQSHAWAIGYGVAALLVLACAVALGLRPANRVEAPVARRRKIGRRDRARWLVLAAVPSSLMLGTTTYLTRDLTPVPLLWVIPLALYLATFILVFAPGVRAERLARVGRLALPPVAILLVYTLAIGSQKPLGLLLALHLIGLTVAALMCHARLAADRPPPSGLTEFYLWVAAGGVLGGVFNAIVAPALLPTLIEYPAAIVAACLLLPRGEKKRPDLLEFFLRDARPTKLMDYVVPLLLGGALAIALELSRPRGGGEPSFAARTAIIGLFCGLSLNLARRPVRFGLGIAAILVAASLALVPGEKTLDRDRSFFGIYKVVATGPFHELYDGTTVHGLQRVDSREPLEYYSPAGPAGQVLKVRTGRLGVVGLGAGAMSCYRPGATTFFEIDPAVVGIARNPRLFTYLHDCPARVVVGDGRLTLQRERGKFDVLAIDAFNSDAIPIHLITREALQLYFQRVRPNGVVLFHISNRYVRLEPVLASLARDLGVQCRARRHVPTNAQQDRGYAISKWAVLTRRQSDFGPRWHPCEDDGTRVWTDDYSDLLGSMSFG